MDSYSLFFDGTKPVLGSTGLDRALADKGVKTVVLSGIATDYVVGRTAEDALSLGLTTFVVEDLIRGITDEGIDEWRGKIIVGGGVMVSTARQMAADSARWGYNRAAYYSGGASSSCK